jgi:hypothetical protein
MKYIALTYDYDLSKLSDIGRKWSFDVYKDKNFIFDYSSASYATFIDKNPNSILHLYTDDVQLMKEKMSHYNINQENIVYIDYSENLKKYINNLNYSFDVLNDFINYAKSNTEFTVKIDNDLIFKNELKNINYDSILVWKYERVVSQGDIRWGEIKICQQVLNNINFKIYNLGLFGFPPNFENEEVKDVMNKLTSVDISDVTDVNSKIYHCCEQTANNWVFHKKNYNIIETFDIVDHLFDNKGECINRAKYLKHG